MLESIQAVDAGGGVQWVRAVQFKTNSFDQSCRLCYDKHMDIMDIIFAALALAGLYVIYYSITRFLLKFIFQRKPKNWVAQNYKNHPDVDFEKVNKVVASGILTTEEFSRQEMVAVFGLLLLKTEVPDVIHRAKIFGRQGWEKKFDHAFYEEIAKRAIRISTQWHKKSARNLIMFGQRLAEVYQDKNWAGEYKKILDKLLAEQAHLERDARLRFKK